MLNNAAEAEEPAAEAQTDKYLPRLEAMFGKDQVKTEDCHEGKFGYRIVRYKRAKVTFLIDLPDLERFIAKQEALYKQPAAVAQTAVETLSETFYAIRFPDGTYHPHHQKTIGEIPAEYRLETAEYMREVIADKMESKRIHERAKQDYAAVEILRVEAIYKLTPVK